MDVEDVVSRQSLLLDPEHFADMSIDSRASAMSSVSSESQAAQSSKRRTEGNTDTHPFIGLKSIHFHDLRAPGICTFLHIGRTTLY